LQRPAPKICDERNITRMGTIVRKGLTMSLLRTRLLKKAEAAERTMSFHFEKPAGFTYRAGQFADYTLLDPPETDGEGNIRGFSLASAPFESSLMATTRLRDTAFKRVLRMLPLGSELELDAPYGSFTLHNKEVRPAVFLTGGIGITPVRSIVLQSVHDKTKHTIFVFCSNRRPEDAVFLDEFGHVGTENDNITFVATMTETERSKQAWDGEIGFIDMDMIGSYVNDLTVPIYYLCGPPGMVTAMRTLLNGAGVDDDDIRTEEFAGYSTAR
jgi:ferredoxin-NADP reductase